jgi:hypothetical protein
MSILVIFIVIGIIVNSIIAHLVGINGSKKEIGYWTSFLVSFFTTPIIGLLLVLTSKEKLEVELQDNEVLNNNVKIVKPSLLDNIIALLIFVFIICLIYFMINY